MASFHSNFSVFGHGFTLTKFKCFLIWTQRGQFKVLLSFRSLVRPHLSHRGSAVQHFSHSTDYPAVSYDKCHAGVKRACHYPPQLMWWQSAMAKWLLKIWRAFSSSPLSVSLLIANVKYQFAFFNSFAIIPILRNELERPCFTVKDAVSWYMRWSGS